MSKPSCGTTRKGELTHPFTWILTISNFLVRFRGSIQKGKSGDPQPTYLATLRDCGKLQARPILPLSGLPLMGTTGGFSVKRPPCPTLPTLLAQGGCGDLGHQTPLNLGELGFLLGCAPSGTAPGPSLHKSGLSCVLPGRDKGPVSG